MTLAQSCMISGTLDNARARCYNVPMSKAKIYYMVATVVVAIATALLAYYVSPIAVVIALAWFAFGHNTIGWFTNA